MLSASRGKDSKQPNQQDYVKPEVKEKPADDDDRNDDSFEELLELVIRYLNQNKDEQRPDYRHGVVEAKDVCLVEH